MIPTKPLREVYNYLFNHPTIIQAMVMRFPDHWRYYAGMIRDQLPLDKEGTDGLRVIQETVAAESVRVDQFYAHDGLREFRIRTMQFEKLHWLQHQNGNVLGYFDSAEDAISYAKTLYRQDIARFEKLLRKFRTIDHSGLDEHEP